MSSASGNNGRVSTQALFSSPTLNSRASQSSRPVTESEPRQVGVVSEHDGGSNFIQRFSHRRTGSLAKDEKHIKWPRHHPNAQPASSSSTYMGSYRRSPRISRVSLGASGLNTPEGSRHSSPRASTSHVNLDNLIQNLDLDLETYGVEEFRDGFFDAEFFKPPKEDMSKLMKMAEYTLPIVFKKRHPLSVRAFLPRQWHEVKGVLRRVCTTRAGIKLSKSFGAFFITYILCLIPATSNWLGPFNYIMPLSAVINHPGRTVGSQIDGVFFTILGTALGLGWGALALYVSDSTSVARSGYGGILATFLVIFMAFAAAMRSYIIRSYHMVLTAGIAVIYTCLADTSDAIGWAKLLNYGIPWLIGQAICLVVCCVAFPDAGARPLAIALHDAFAVMQDALVLPHSDSVMIHRQLTWTFVNLSQAYRDLVLDFSVTRFPPSDIRTLRNLMQGVIRALLGLKTETELFEVFDQSHRTDLDPADEAVIDIDDEVLPKGRSPAENTAIRLVTSKLSEPTLNLLDCLRNSMTTCDAVLLDMSGYRKYIGPPLEVSSDILGTLTAIRKAMIRFDDEDDALSGNPELPATFSDHPELVKLFLFVNPIRQAATSAEALLVKVMQMQQDRNNWRIYRPSYPLAKSLQRTNAQVRHDRGGATAGFFFRSQRQLQRILRNMQNSTYRPLPRHTTGLADLDLPVHEADQDEEDEDKDVVMDRGTAPKKKSRYKLWLFLHRLQGFETRFSLKVVLVVILLSVPDWLSQSRGWYIEYQSWWAVIFGWIMMHPRVGGNFQDLITRSLTCVIGAAWGGIAYVAGNGSPYVMAVFAAIYMLPMLYRFTQSSHPRSGIVGCISFTVVSLHVYRVQDSSQVVTISYTHALSFVVGVISAITVNWILWPFIARHELRKAISTMMLHLAIIYRGVVSKYIYYEDGEEPTEADVLRSELLEGRLREGFVRIRQLLALTRHEVRLRGPFNPLPYSALIENCESFFEHLVEVRQSSLFFHPAYLSTNTGASAALLPFRRDAVATILINLYVLAGALRGNRKVPRYLPSAAAARKRLLVRMAQIEMELVGERNNFEEGDAEVAHGDENLSKNETTNNQLPKKGVGRKFAEVYQFAYSQALTGCVEQLEELQKYTKAICGEAGFDPVEDVEYEVDSRNENEK